MYAEELSGRDGSNLSTQILTNSHKLFQRRLQVLSKTCSEYIRRWQRISSLQAFVTQPEVINADFVALELFIVAERMKAFAFWR